MNAKDMQILMEQYYKFNGIPLLVITLFESLLKGENLKFYGSQGQQRVAVLSLKLSEIEIFKKYKNTTPILLLDDIFSELDDIKKNNLLKYINKDIQTIITCPGLDEFVNNRFKINKVFKIVEGSVAEGN